MNISVLIPTRGDRPQFLSNAHRLLEAQTLKPTHVEVVDDPPKDAAKKDITWRYRIGCERILAANPNTEAIVLIEDDDWYAHNYIETMYNNWINAGRPLVYGIGETIYYHLGMRAWLKYTHLPRASAMSTLMSAAGASKMRWPDDNYVFTDIEIWKKLTGKTFIPDKPISIGIKGYKEGALFGGIGHRWDLCQYKINDEELNWLKDKVDSTSFEFYKKMSDLARNTGTK
jgi:glycosyltransferase involved in cell wall biosynthesis